MKKAPCTTTIPHGSGTKHVIHPNELRVLFEDDIQIIENGYLYAYVSNGSSKGINFDNFLVTYAEATKREELLRWSNLASGELVGWRQINHYYPYDRARTWQGRKGVRTDGLTIAGIHGDYDDYLNKYTSKELQTGEFDPTVSTSLEMLDFGSRFYDPQVGRPDGFSFQLQWFTPDPATGGSPFWTEQFANPYLAIGTTKREELLRWSNLASGELVGQAVMYVDPDGEFIVPLLAGMAYGALIGAGTSAAIYSVTAGINGTWNWDDLGKTMAFGAVGGALGGGLGFLGTQLNISQSLGFNVLSNVASNSATTLSFGGEVTLGSLAGMVVGGVVGAGIGNFTGVEGSALKNIGAELAFGTAKGAATGFFGTGVGIAIDGMTGNPHANPGQSLLDGIVNGAIAGGTVAGLNIASMGAAYKPEREYGDFGKDKPVYRRGTFLTRALFPGSGVAIGRNLVVNRVKEPPPGYSYLDRDTGWPLIPSKMTQEIEAHETYHYVQQRQMGFANFYSRTLGEYIKYGQLNTYCTPGTLEWDADMFGIQQLGNSIYR